ncbi:unnamed protein product [Rotaria magnacalcarata]|uniref:Sodefrin-like factor n=1 Tax=Rotaria magnacalcarata TaxID=392030 RepID=A0A816BG89_9BILA|nr:unnamed protein product [Rotaria magnacalcarata]CAF1607833.1 unnamed protein product [Rotaria magnacalcarata]CAF2030476.1 unnamed protein product [Rotaria magnacalcarata]CAF2159767.1 unnamed protein product [Rotaria magnacalcarata]CAF4108684.1 unnamed protein product [Rotaria magnacalcarata]
MNGYIFSSLYFTILIFLLSVQFTSTLDCFDCKNCDSIASCTCDTIKSVDANNSYCILLRETSQGANNFEIRHIPWDYTPYISDPYHISVVETISYNEITRRWFSISNKIIYACQTDRCNRADLLKQLPANGLSLMLPDNWLSENLLRKSSKDTIICRECISENKCNHGTRIINADQCSVKICQSACLMDEKFDTTDRTQFCYESVCSDDESVDPKFLLSQITITAVYYINKKQLETVEMNVVCNGADCSRLQIFRDVRNKLQKDLNNIKPFLPMNHGNTIYSTSFIFLIMALLQAFISY